MPERASANYPFAKKDWAFDNGFLRARDKFIKYVLYCIA